jgi:hypothetical protein
MIKMTRRLFGLLFTVAVAVGLVAAPTAGATGTERWLLTGASSVPVTYWQGLTSDSKATNLYFAGIFEGLWRTTPLLRQTAGISSAIPPAVKQSEGYNHIGDPTWDEGRGGRIILPLECYTPGVGNTCGTGSFGIADPASLAFRYYVKLDPAEIEKAMWAEISPDGSSIWTSAGNDLLAFRARAVSRANRAPEGPLLTPVRRLHDAVPPSGVTGATFHRGRLLLAGQDGGSHQVWSVNTETGKRRLELERNICGESEGLDVVRTLGGKLHWLIAPFDPGCELSFGPTSALLHLVRAPAHRRFKVKIRDIDAGPIPGDVNVKVRATRKRRPLRRARVSFAGARARTNKRGIARLATRLEQPGRFKAVARRGQNYGASKLVPIGIQMLAPRVPVPRTGAG